MTALMRSVQKIFFPLLILGLGAAGGLAASFSVSEIYAGEAALKIGKVAVYEVIKDRLRARQNLTLVEKHTRFLVARSIELPEELLEELRAAYQVPAARNGRLKSPYLYNVVLRDGGTIILSARGSSPVEIREFLQDVLDRILSRHREIMERQRMLIELQYETLGQLVSQPSTEKLPRFMTALLDSLQAREQRIIPEGAILSVSEKTLLMYQDFGEALMPVNLFPTRVTLEPTVLDSRLRPNRILYAVVGLIMMSLLILFYLVYRNFSLHALVEELKALRS